MKNLDQVMSAFEAAALNAGLKRNTRKTSARPLRKSGTPGATGALTAPEKTKLVLQAKDAWAHQLARDLIPASTSFDAFRSDQVQACCGLSGISKLNRSHWRPVMAHFLTLAGREGDAFDLLQKTGEKTYRGGNPGDTWETAEAYAHQIETALHLHSSADLAEGMTRIETGWFLVAARQRSGKPSLTMDTLAERLDPQTLRSLLSHLRSHIALREGRADQARRSVRQYHITPDPGQIDDPF